jgi:hypothetical protein
VLLETAEKMVSGHTPEGSAVRLRVVRDVLDANGSVVIAYDSLARGRVTRSRGRGMFGKAGQLEFTVDSVEGADGTAVPLRAAEEMAGQGNKGAVVATVLFLSVLGVFVHGQDVTVPEDTQIVAYVDRATEIRSPLPGRPGGVPKGEPMEEAAIVSPLPGQVIAIGSDLRVEVKATPESKVAGVKVFVNEQPVGEQQGAPQPFMLPTRRRSAGQYTVEAEVQFLSGRRIKTAPVVVSLAAASR